MEENVLLGIVAEILEVEVGQIALADELEGLGWDSLSNISFIAEVDTVSGIKLDSDALAEATTVADLQALVAGA